MGLFEFIWDVSQEGRIRQAQETAHRSALDASQAQSSAQESSERLTETIERLGLVTQAMWELLRDRTELTEAQLADKVQEVDLRDGVADGRRGRQAVTCPTCKRPNRGARLRCLYCAAPLDAGTAVFDRV